MSIINFATIPEKGHLNPMIGTAQYLQEMGEQVIFTAPKDMSAQLEKAGLNFDTSLVMNMDSRPTQGKELVDLIKDPQSLDQWIRQLLLADLTPQVNAYTEYYKNLSPDVVVVDPLLYAPVIAAHSLNIPWVALSNSLNPVINDQMKSPLLTTINNIRTKRDEIFASHGVSVKFSGCDAISPYLTIAFTTPELSLIDDPSIVQVGPTFPKFLRGDEVHFERRYPERKLVYASFGSQIYYWPTFFERLIKASAHLEVELAISLGNLITHPSFKELPHCVQGFDYAPQRSILKEASLFLSHGGANSFMEAIYYGVPMIMAPICNDQVHQGWFVEKHKLGITHNLPDSSEDELAALLKSCLSDSAWHPGLEPITQSYQRNGALEAAERIRTLC
ncbi:glycosyltransferase [Myxococcota bacterium]|nr:glycosyltransferase [Myxococcota bacterium]